MYGESGPQNDKMQQRISALGLVVGLAAAGAAPPPALCSAFLLGSSGVWGGDDTYVTETGDFWLRRLQVDPATSRMRERRHRLALSSSARSELSDLVARYRVAGLKSSKRGPPDTPRVLLGVTPCGKRLASVERSPNDRDPRFEPLYAWFKRQSVEAERMPPAYDGVPDHQWRPEGVPEIPKWNW